MPWTVWRFCLGAAVPTIVLVVWTVSRVTDYESGFSFSGITFLSDSLLPLGSFENKAYEFVHENMGTDKPTPAI